jgi:signal transduction histidine kinase
VIFVEDRASDALFLVLEGSVVFTKKTDGSSQNVSQASAGTGLDSAIIKSIVDAHQGNVEFKTGAGGTTFTIDLPRGT